MIIINIQLGVLVQVFVQRLLECFPLLAELQVLLVSNFFHLHRIFVPLSARYELQQLVRPDTPRWIQRYTLLKYFPQTLQQINMKGKGCIVTQKGPT